MKKIFISLFLMMFVFSIISEEANEGEEDSNNLNKLLKKNYTFSINFKYQNLVIETKKDKNGNIEETIIRDYGQSDLNLLLIDSIYYNLNYEKKLSVTKYLEKADFFIIIHPTKPEFGSIVIEIIILNKNKDLLKRKIVQDRYDGFTELNNKLLSAIIDLIKNL